jgi:uncharacterized peroxidase-related enzyme
LHDDDRVRAIERDYRSAILSPRERAILDYTAKLTRTPHDMEPADVRCLRDVGLDDGEILDVCQVAAYYNYVNRLADGLGVELERYWPESPNAGSVDDRA